MKRIVFALAVLAGCTTRIAHVDQPVVGGDAGTGIFGSWVLDFAGSTTQAPHVNHGYFWPHDGSQLGTFLVQAWVMPRDAGSRYWLSAGDGGDHEILAGFISAGPGTPNQIAAAFQNPQASCWVHGNSLIQPGTWVHVAIGWDGQYLRAFLNGALDGKAACAGPRLAIAVSGGGGILFVGGSDHSNFDGRIAEIELWEGTYPLAVADGPFYYQRRFTASAWNGTTAIPSSFLAYYTTPADMIADFSPTGYGGVKHPGIPYAADINYDPGFGVLGAGAPAMLPSQGMMPTWAFDANAPTAQ